MRNLFLIFVGIVAMVFDTIIFARFNIYGIRPDTMLAVLVSCAVYSGSKPGALMGLIMGFAVDLLFCSFLGLNMALYMLCGIAGGFFYGKFYANNVIIPAAAALVLAVIKELLAGLAAIAQGAPVSVFSMFVRFILPCALLTALATVLVHLLFKRFFTSQTRRVKKIKA